jgi:TolB-like protein
VSGAGVEPQRLALLALLALHPKRTVSRAELTRHLWPTLNGEQARQALNQALFAISKALGDDAIFPSAKEVRLGTRVSVDALEFQSALDAGRTEDATRLYTAPLLDGFELRDAPEFQRWAETQRARFAAVAEVQQPLPAAASGELHDLAEPATHTRAEQASDALSGELRETVLPDPELLKNAAAVEQESVAPAAPAEPALMTNAVPEQASGAPVPQPETREPENVVPQPSAPRDEVQWITPSDPPPSPAAREGAANVPPPPASPPQESVLLAGEPPAPVESKPEEERVKRRRRKLRLPSARLVVTVLSLVALGAFGYMARGRIGVIARGWFGVARGRIETVRGRARARADSAQQARDRKRSIAVLPIEYHGRNRADAALAARIVAELGPMLARAGLLVVPSAALARGGLPNDLRVIADSLRVAYILQGVMQREDSGVAFRFRLVNPADGTTRWGYTYRPQLADIPVMQEDVATLVARRILQESREAP